MNYTKINRHRSEQLENLGQFLEQHTSSVDWKITASFGISEYNTGEVAEITLQRADNALYSAKQNGRNRCIVPAAPKDSTKMD